MSSVSLQYYALHAWLQNTNWTLSVVEETEFYWFKWVSKSPSNRNTRSREPVTNVCNPAEELYRRNAILGGCKIIYIEINSFVGTGVWAKQWNEIQWMRKSITKVSVLCNDIILRDTNKTFWTYRMWRNWSCCRLTWGCLWLTLQVIKQKKISSPGAPLTSPLRDAAIPAIIYLCPQPYAHWSGKAAVNGDDPSVPPKPL